MKSMKESLLRLAAENERLTSGHRKKFTETIQYIRRVLDENPDPNSIWKYSLNGSFTSAELIARDDLKMTKAEFESAVECLNTEHCRVVDRHPSGKYPESWTEFMKIEGENLSFQYDLAAPIDAAYFILLRGAEVGYTASQIASAKKEYMHLERLRREKIAAEDEVRRLEESARIEARIKAGYTMSVYKPPIASH